MIYAQDIFILIHLTMHTTYSSQSIN